jgi:hypothetical protein
MMSMTLSFVDKRQFLSVIQPVPTSAESTVVESPSADPAPVESSPTDPAPAEPIHSVVVDALTEAS